jgi:hypothetical protein
MNLPAKRLSAEKEKSVTKYLIALFTSVFALSICITASAQEPAAKGPVAQKPVATEPAAKKPAVKEPTVQKPTAKKPAVKEPAGEKDFRAVEELKVKGFNSCADTVGLVLKFLNKRDDFAFRNTWHEKSANAHTASVFTIKSYGDGNSYASVNTSPRPDGGCDAGFTQVFFFYESCTTMRDSSFKDWKFYMDFGNVPVYEDPTSKNVVIALAPLVNGCLVLKSGTFYFPPKKK